MELIAHGIIRLAFSAHVCHEIKTMKMRILVAVFGCLVLFRAAALTENFDRDGDSGLPAGWKATNGSWSVKSGGLWVKPDGGVASHMVVESAGTGSDVVVSARVLIRKHEGSNWLIAGVGIRQSATNYWHLALIESPPANGGKHSMELLECLNGVRNGQSATDSKLKELQNKHKQFDWEYNHAYLLKIHMTESKIEGVVSEPDGVAISRIIFELKDPAVRSGTPMLAASQAAAVFDDVHADVANTGR